MLYKKNKTSAISFPLGGIGAGCIGLAGNGSLTDWEIFNHANKGRRNGCSHFAVRAEKDGRVLDFRILNGDLPAPYMGEVSDKPFTGFGFGPNKSTMAHWPHFRNHTFDGTFPTCKMTFGGEKFPADAELTAWSVFIPGDSRDSSLPAAFFEITLTAKETMDFSVLGALHNPWIPEMPVRGARNQRHGNQLTLFSHSDSEDEITLTAMPAKTSTVSGQTYSDSGWWQEDQERYRHDVMLGGPLPERNRLSDDWAGRRNIFGTLAQHATIKAGEKCTFTYIITWHIPNCRNDWQDDADKRAAENGVENHWRTWYSTQWKNSRESGKYAVRNFKKLRSETFLFRDALFSASVPPKILNGISANLSVLKSPTCLRLQDGTFWGWEGVGTTWGSCPGSCAHVWNYAQALPYLFPDLERSMRTAGLKYSVDENGGFHFRLMLPLGIHATASDFRPCADGQFGEIMKFYRDWKICGDDTWLKTWWSTLKRMLEYAWSKKNPDRWDPNRTGVLHGRQHHTLDMELFGPNLWLTGHYLGALEAMARMAEHLRDGKYAVRCRNMAVKGRKWCEENLFNGEYFEQALDFNDTSVADVFQADNYKDTESKQLRYQAGKGCLIDTPLAQWYARLYGLDDLYSPEMNRKTLLSIYRYNFVPSMRDVVNLWRMYSLNGEGGTRIATWPRGGKPVIPLPYHSETMTGFEWSFAAQMIYEGFLTKGERVATAIRNRFDGENRNPWNELECGSNYARSMASFGVLTAYSGFLYADHVISFDPRLKTGTFFWSIGTAWGVFVLSDNSAELKVLHGCLTLREWNVCNQGTKRFKKLTKISADGTSSVKMKWRA